jgi:putative membrane-bound dehydrogenase-like protein
MRLILTILVVSLTATCPCSFAQDADSVDRDYSDELPRIAPLEPDEALESFEVHPGFRMELVAAEPLVRDPIAMAFDENGRLFVVEMRGYSERRDENIGTIRLLTDDDGDGKYDRATDYVDGLAWPTAVACWDGGLFVAVAPDIIYCKDTDGDGRADIRETVFTGFGLSNVQGLVNSFQWGPDNRIHGATSSSGATVTSPTNPGMTPLVLRGRDFSFDPVTREIRAESGGGQHGLTFDAFGNKFVCHNSNHCQFIAYEDRYIARNPYMRAPAANVSIAVDGMAADVFRISDVEPWRIVRTRLRVKGLVPGPVEGGGTAAGYFTSATGITVYKGDAWPAEYRGNLFIGDVGSNLIHRKTVSWDGILPVADRADANTEFVRSRDIWFRPVQFCNGPDGALYVADMYREVIEHPDSLHPVIKQHLDLNSGFDRGRIYRIVPEDFEQPAIPKLGAATSAELTPHLISANAWQRETAARLLYQRQDAAVVPPLKQLARNALQPEAHAAVLTTLRGLNEIAAEDIAPHLESADPALRAFAARLAEDFPENEKLASALGALAMDEVARVRYQSGFSLGALPRDQRIAPLVQLAKLYGEDAWMRTAIESSAADVADRVLAKLLQQDGWADSPGAAEISRMLAPLAGATGDHEGLTTLLNELYDRGLVPGPVATDILVAARDAGRGALLREITEQNAWLGDHLDAMSADAARIARDTNAEQDARVSAVNALTFGEYESAAPILTALLSPGEPQAVQLAALHAFRQYPDQDVVPDVVGAWDTLSPAVRAEAVELLLARERWVAGVLSAVQKGTVERTAFDSTHVARLQSHESEAVRKSAKTIFAAAVNPDREAVVAKYRPALDKSGNAEQGRAFFAENCATCHRFGDVGNDVGPNLTGFAQGGAEKILVNVLDPNREVNPQYTSYVVDTNNFETYSGVVASETASSVTLKRANGVADTILRMNIESMRSEGRSLMPEGWEESLDLQGMADLIAYLSKGL